MADDTPIDDESSDLVTDGGTADVEGPSIQNPETELVSAGALEEAPSGDLRVTSEFGSLWDEAIADIKDEDEDMRDELVDLMGIDSDGDVELEEVGGAFRITIDGRLVGSLESQAAFYADLAGARILSDRIDQWDELPVADRSRLLKGLRLFLETCPECGNDVVFDTKEVESCCGSYQVAAVDCDECGSRLFESAPIDEDL
jgi:rRNA maturation protein Nop10